MAISNNARGSQPGVCTSTTRPTAPYEGQMIYETDTDLTYVWGGSAWQQVSGGTAVGNSGLVYIGSITTTATVIYLDGVFTSKYDNYLCTFQNTSVSVTGTCHWRVRASTTPLTSNYRWGSTAYYYDSGTGFSYSTTSAAGIPFSVGSGTSYGSGVLTIMNPALASKTTTISDGTSDYSNYVGFNLRGYVNNTTAYDGIQVYQDAGGSITGTLRVYGMRQA